MQQTANCVSAMHPADIAGCAAGVAVATTDWVVVGRMWRRRRALPPPAPKQRRILMAISCRMQRPKGIGNSSGATFSLPIGTRGASAFSF